jgi:TatD DNase family protein
MLKSENAKRLVAAIPRDRLLTETDGPFTQRDGRPARLSDIPQIVEQLAQFLAVPADELRRQIRSNLKSLLT